MTAYSYTCTDAKIRKIVGTYGQKHAILCDLLFENEHGHELAPVSNVLVVLEDNEAHIEKYPENVLGEDATDAEYNAFLELCQNELGYEVANPAGLAVALHKLLTDSSLETIRQQLQEQLYQVRDTKSQRLLMIAPLTTITQALRLKNAAIERIQHETERGICIIHMNGQEGPVRTDHGSATIAKFDNNILPQ